MSYRINLEIEEGSKADLNIKRLADSEHLSNEVAALKLISTLGSAEETPVELVRRLKREREFRRSKNDKLASGEPDRVIGAFADYPEAIASIESFAMERRKDAYGS